MKGARRRTVLWSALVAGFALAALMALLASAKPGQQASSPLVGKPAPTISGPVLGGSVEVSLGQFSGKWVLVNFAASWCIPCRQETPQLAAFEREHAAPHDAVIIAVSYDPSDTSRLASFLRSEHATWPAVDDGAAVVSYGVTGVPESYLVDPAGRVVAKYVGGVTAASVDSFISHATQ